MMLDHLVFNIEAVSVTFRPGLPTTIISSVLTTILSCVFTTMISLVSVHPYHTPTPTVQGWFFAHIQGLCPISFIFPFFFNFFFIFFGRFSFNFLFHFFWCFFFKIFPDFCSQFSSHANACQFCRPIRAQTRLSQSKSKAQPEILWKKQKNGVNPYYSNWIRINLDECEWRAAAPGLKPLHLPRARAETHTGKEKELVTREAKSQSTCIET